LFESQAMYCYQKSKVSIIYTFLHILNISWGVNHFRRC